MTAQDSSVIREHLRDYKISDGILFDCLLDEGDYLIPLTVDRNAYIPGRVPPQWIPDLQQYPKPEVSYMKPSNMSLPLRVEMFECSEDQQRKAFDLLIHSCRLLPKYSFPAGLDIVDKHAKIPAWMSKPVNSHLMAQVMKGTLLKMVSIKGLIPVLRLSNFLNQTECIIPEKLYWAHLQI